MKKLVCYVCGGLLEMNADNQEVVCMDCGVHYTIEQVKQMYSNMQERATVSVHEIAHWKQVIQECVKKYEFSKAEWLLEEVLMVAPQDEEVQKLLKQVQDWKNYHFINGVLVGYSGQSKHLVLPDGVVEISTIDTFMEGECNSFPRDIESIVFPDSVEVIGPFAFDKCEYLTQVRWPKNLRIIGKEAFGKCKRLYMVNLPSRVEEIHDFAFWECSNLRKINFPSTLRYIGQGAFGGCESLEEVCIPDGVEEIPWVTFERCYRLKRVELPRSLKMLGAQAFKNCSQLLGIELPEGLESIGKETFASCTLFKNIRIPRSVKKIGENAFAECRQLNHIQHQKSFPRYIVAKTYISKSGCNIYYDSGMDEYDVMYDVFAGCPYGDKGQEIMWNRRYTHKFCPQCGVFMYDVTKCEMCGDARFYWYWKLKILKWKRGKFRR